MTGMTYVETSVYTIMMLVIRCVVHYEPCLMTGMTYVRTSD